MLYCHLHCWSCRPAADNDHDKCTGRLMALLEEASSRMSRFRKQRSSVIWQKPLLFPVSESILLRFFLLGWFKVAPTSCFFPRCRLEHTQTERRRYCQDPVVAAANESTVFRAGKIYVHLVTNRHPLEVTFWANSTIVARWLARSNRTEEALSGFVNQFRSFLSYS